MDAEAKNFPVIAVINTGIMGIVNWKPGTSSCEGS